MNYLKLYLRNGLFVWLVFLISACSKSNEEIDISNDDIIAEVNGGEITVGNLRDEIRFLMRQFRVNKRDELKNEEKLALKIKGLNRLIRNKILIVEATSRKIILNQDEFNIGFVETKSGYEGESFDEYLKNEGISSELWKDRLRNNLLIQKFIKTIFGAKNFADETRARDYYKVNKNKFKVGVMVHAFHIMVSTEDKARIVQELIKSRKKNFSELARIYSLAPEANTGGDLGYFEISQMPDEFGIIVNLKKNQISETIKTPHGYHIFKVIDVNAARQMSFSESKSIIFSKFARDKQSEDFERWLLGKKNNSIIKINENVLSEFSL